MHVPLSDAKARLTELVRKAEAGEEVVLTRHGQPAARIVPVAPAIDVQARRRLFTELRQAASRKARPGPEAARAADFLYDEDGLPG